MKAASTFAELVAGDKSPLTFAKARSAKRGSWMIHASSSGSILVVDVFF
jgi:hypothetical protein